MSERRAKTVWLLLILPLASKSLKNLKDIYLLTGSNIEPREKFLDQAKNEITKKVGEISNASMIYESEPWGFHDETSFLNQVLIVNTDQKASVVLKTILEIEKRMGRQRVGKNYSSRNIDIDILYFGDEIIEEENLQVPHPRLHLRKFTLIPLAEVSSIFEHPVFKVSNMELLKKCDDNSIVNIFKESSVEV